MITKISVGEMILDFIAFIIIAFLMGLLVSILDIKRDKKEDDPFQIGPDPEPQQNVGKKLPVTKDPLRILREDTYSNEEINEITERMISSQNNTHHDNLPE